jgi:putative chitinase
MSFDFDFTADDLDDAMAGLKDSADWFTSLSNILPTYNVTSVKRVAMFLAQTGHESGSYNELQENLNYSATALTEVFGRYFRTLDVNDYAHQPEKIANLVYSGRMGNGDEESGDGWKYHGRGILQITGKENYGLCSTAVYGDDRLLDNPDLLIEKDGAIASACWFWNTRQLNAWSDAENIREVTRRINGGYNGLADRQARYTKALNALSD